MKDGKYMVKSYNEKDAVLIHEDGETFEVLSRIEFPPSFSRRAFIGETIIVEHIQVIRPEHQVFEERERSGNANYTKEFQRLKDFQTKENARRALYGGIHGVKA